MTIGGRNITGVFYIHTDVSTDRDYKVMRGTTTCCSNRHYIRLFPDIPCNIRKKNDGLNQMVVGVALYDRGEQGLTTLTVDRGAILGLKNT